MTRPQKIRLRKNQRRWQPLGTNQFLRAVAVCENAIDQCRALNESAFQRRPFIRRDHEGQGIELPRTLRATRIAVNVVSDALLIDEPPRGIGATLQFFGAEM